MRVRGKHFELISLSALPNLERSREHSTVTPSWRNILHERETSRSTRGSSLGTKATQEWRGVGHDPHTSRAVPNISC